MQTYVYSDKMAVSKSECQSKTELWIEMWKKTYSVQRKRYDTVNIFCIKYMNQYLYGSSSDVPRKRL